MRINKKLLLFVLLTTTLLSIIGPASLLKGMSEAYEPFSWGFKPEPIRLPKLKQSSMIGDLPPEVATHIVELAPDKQTQLYFSSLNKIHRAIGERSTHRSLHIPLKELVDARRAYEHTTKLTIIIGKDEVLTAAELALININFPKLISLTLKYPEFNDENSSAGKDLAELSTSLLAERLQELAVNTDTDHAFANLAKENWNSFKNLASLILGSVRFTNESFLSLANSNIAPNLEYLYLDGNGLSADIFTTEKLNNFKKLKKLFVLYNPLSDTGFVNLARSRVAPTLEELTLEYNDTDSFDPDTSITEASFTIENLNNFRGLKKLTILNNFIKDVGFTALANSTVAKKLEELTLKENDITQASFTIENLNKFENLKALTVYNDIGITGLAALIDSSLGEKLKEINIFADSNQGTQMKSYLANQDPTKLRKFKKLTINKEALNLPNPG